MDDFYCEEMIIVKDELVNSINPFVSVDIITYNHEKYISKAIEGVLMQKTDFIYEIVICDDSSSDETQQILYEYQRKFKDKIILRIQKENKGLKHNYFENKKACRGKYIAICEGDDYWTNPNKLQMEVNFLENNQDYAMIFTNAYELFEENNGDEMPKPFGNLQNRDYSGSEILENWTIPTGTVVYRNNISYHFNYLDNFLFYDTPLFLRIVDCGKIICINELTAVYRRHQNSITFKPLNLNQILSYFKGINLEFPGKYSSVLSLLSAKECFLEAKRCRYKNKLKACYYLFLSIYYKPTFILFKIINKIRNIT